MKRAMMWPLGISALLTLTVGANIALYVVARDDPSFAIEPNYYAKAVAWDSTVAQGRRNAALGWRLTPALGAYTAGEGALLSVTLTDSSGARIADAVVNVSALYTARAARVLASTMVADEHGYRTRLAVQHVGQWELRFDVSRGTDRFTAVSRVESVRAPGT